MGKSIIAENEKEQVARGSASDAEERGVVEDRLEERAVELTADEQREVTAYARFSDRRKSAIVAIVAYAALLARQSLHRIVSVHLLIDLCSLFLKLLPPLHPQYLERPLHLTRNDQRQHSNLYRRPRALPTPLGALRRLSRSSPHLLHFPPHLHRRISRSSAQPKLWRIGRLADRSGNRIVGRFVRWSRDDWRSVSAREERESDGVLLWWDSDRSRPCAAVWR